MRIDRAVRTIWPFHLDILVVLLLTTCVPALSLAFRALIGQ